MGLGRWLRRLFAPAPRAAAPRPEPRASAPPTEPTPAAPAEGPADEAPEIEAPEFPEPSSGVGPLDAPNETCGTEDRLVERIGHRVEQREFRLPILPSTSLRLLDLANDPSVDLGRIATSVERDPVLSSELLKSANSVLHGGTRRTKTLSDAVVRLGTRNLRTLILGLSMRTVLLRNKGLTQYASEVWRQCNSMATLSREIARALRLDPERAFLVGLLHDIGKVALLDLIQQEAGTRFEVNRALVGRVFHDWHEEVGARMAEAWQLPDEISAVAANHHAFDSNEIEPVGAATASLAHKMDLLLSLGAEREYRALAHGREMDVLDLGWDPRRALLDRCVETFKTQAAAAAEAAG